MPATPSRPMSATSTELPLRVPAKLGEQAIEELVTVRFEFSRWLPAGFPLPAEKGATVTQADFPAIVADIRAEGERELGKDFDVPQARAE